uniref:Uncharacterized protein n=1 Tax=Arundo donax TaxID=35708 RepID=A0A0A9AKS5_ARUDO
MKRWSLLFALQHPCCFDLKFCRETYLLVCQVEFKLHLNHVYTV